MRYTNEIQNVRYILRSVNDCTEQQLILFLSDVMCAERVRLLLTTFKDAREIDWEPITGKIHWRGGAEFSRNDRDLNIYAFWVIATVKFMSVRDIRLQEYPTQFMFITEDNMIHDITVVTDRSIAYAARKRWEDSNTKEMPDMTSHIALVFDEDGAREIAPYGFDSYCILDDNHVPHHGIWGEDNELIPYEVAQTERVFDHENDHGEGMQFIENESFFLTRLQSTENELECLQEYEKDIRAVRVKMESIVKKVKEEQGDERFLLYADWARRMGPLLAELSAGVEAIYGSYRDLVNYYPAADEEERRELENACAESFGIEAAFIDNVLVVKTPLVSSGQNLKKFGKSKRYLANQMKVMADEIRSQVEPLIDPESRKFEQKTVMVISVYSRQTKLVPDADNILVKAQTDAITGLLPGGDSFDNCTFFFQNFRRRDCEPGTYFVIADGLGSVIPSSRLIQILQKM